MVARQRELTRRRPITNRVIVNLINLHVDTVGTDSSSEPWKTTHSVILDDCKDLTRATGITTSYRQLNRTVIDVF